MWDLLKSDWEKLPQHFRFLLEVGIILVFNAWVLDHWLPDTILPYKYLGYFDIRVLSYNVGMTLIIFTLALIVIKQIKLLPGLIRSYENKYPIKNIGKTFELVWFNGKLILFDLKTKKFFHVYPWETAQDLNFVSFGTHVPDHFPNPQNPKVKLDSGKFIDITTYQNGGSINTRT